MKPRFKPQVTALTLAGSDSGGGAGIQADLKTFAALGVHGTTAITAITAQNPRGVRSIQATRTSVVIDQIEAVFAELPPSAAKTGMLFSAPIIRAVAIWFGSHRSVPLVVDPVMVATSGARLLQEPAMRALRERLLPLATLATPNLDEAALLWGRPLTTVEDLRLAARHIRSTHGCAVLVKGGHLRGLNEAIDVFWDGREELLLSAPRVRGVSTHGTGCTYSAAITAHLAHGCKLADAVTRAKMFITQAIARSRRVAHHTVLHAFWNQGR
jgi:hydroxymethylpyrimidine/phosphomethylpyrimidine kinase